jgi:hypothetical protein
MGKWRNSSTILHLGTRLEVSGQFHAPPALLLGKEPPVPMDRKLSGPQSRSGRCGVEKHLLQLPGIEL